MPVSSFSTLTFKAAVGNLERREDSNQLLALALPQSPSLQRELPRTRSWVSLLNYTVFPTCSTYLLGSIWIYFFFTGRFSANMFMTLPQLMLKLLWVSSDALIGFPMENNLFLQTDIGAVGGSQRSRAFMDCPPDYCSNSGKQLPAAALKESSTCLIQTSPPFLRPRPILATMQPKSRQLGCRSHVLFSRQLVLARAAPMIS